MIMLQNYAMVIQKSILNNARVFQVLEKIELGNKYGPINLFLGTYNYDNWFENEESAETTSEKSNKEESVDLSDMSPVEGH